MYCHHLPLASKAHVAACWCCSITHIGLLSKAAAFVWKHKRLLQLSLMPYGLIAGNPEVEEMAMMCVLLQAGVSLCVCRWWVCAVGL